MSARKVDMVLVYTLMSRDNVTDQERADRADHTAWRSQQLIKELSGSPLSPLASWILSDAWTDATPYTGAHNQPPVSGEFEAVAACAASDCGRRATYQCNNAPNTCRQHKSSCCVLL